jgi:hypothetical protein
LITVILRTGIWPIAQKWRENSLHRTKKRQVLTRGRSSGEQKVRRLVKAPVIQKITRKTEVGSKALDAVQRFHWVERTK